MIEGHNGYTRSPWGVQVKQLTKICWHLISSPPPPSYRDFSGKVGLNLLVTSRYGHKTVCWRLAVGWSEVTRALVTPNKAIRMWEDIIEILIENKRLLYFPWNSLVYDVRVRLSIDRPDFGVHQLSQNSVFCKWHLLKYTSYISFYLSEHDGESNCMKTN